MNVTDPTPDGESSTCPTCHQPWSVEAGVIPPEPPVGTWVRDRFGGLAKRQGDRWAPPGCIPLASWEPMWRARGPLVECGPWGDDLTPSGSSTEGDVR